MKSSDRTIVLVLPVIAVIVGLWVLVLGPKQSESGELQTKIDELQATLVTAQGQIGEGQAAQKSFKKDYADLVSLGAAAPAGDDQATLIYDMSKLGQENGVSFRSFQVTPGAGGETVATEATATETTVAALPLGATVGPAGLPLMPYNFNYLGNFFDVADFFGRHRRPGRDLRGREEPARQRPPADDRRFRPNRPPKAWISRGPGRLRGDQLPRPRRAGRRRRRKPGRSGGLHRWNDRDHREHTRTDRWGDPVNDLQDKLKQLGNDLRKQRLLPVIAVLVVAIIAVPMALKAGGQEPTPPTELAVALEPMLETQSVLVAETPVLRDFRKRLNSYSKKNPFDQPTPLPVEKASTDEGDAATWATPAPSTPPFPRISPIPVPRTAREPTTARFLRSAAIPETTPVRSATPATPATPGHRVPGDSGDTGDTGDSDDSGDSGDTGDSDTGTGDSGSTGSGQRVLSYEIDAEAGVVGKEKKLAGLESLDFLPGDKNPVLQYVASTTNGKKASFVVSSGIVRVVSDGRCAPSPENCRFLQLKVGQDAQLDYGDGGSLYRVQLLGITRRLDPLKKLMAAAEDIAEPIGFAASSQTG